MGSEVEVSKRRPIRALLRLAILGAVIYGISRMMLEKKAEYANLTESEARRKLIEKMSPRVGSETAAEIAEQVIPKLKQRGIVKPDPMAEAGDDIADAAESAIDDAADAVADAVDSVIKDKD